MIWPPLYPALARQWHPTKNGGLTPAAVAPGSRRRVWWQCPQGHTPGRRRCSPGARAPIARCARAGRCCRGKTTWPQCFPSWPGNGTRRGTGP
ncbi:MAG: zinc-ribbon domain-containing protein [Evtepia gabavorous]